MITLNIYEVMVFKAQMLVYFQLSNIALQFCFIPSAPNLANTMLNESVFRPMLFSTPMVQALLDGTKTQTRRLVNPQPIIDAESGYVFDGKHKSMFKNDQFHQDWKIDFLKYHAKIKIGDTVWVRETHFTDVLGSSFYKTENPPFDNFGSQIRWNPSLFMPKNVCRIWNKVTDVRIERLQDISEQDAIYEGIICEWVELTTMTFSAMDYLTGKMRFDFSAKDSYRSLWIKINGQKSWDENPFVWVYDFEVSLDCPNGFI